MIDGGTAPESLALLADVGRVRQAVEAARGGVSLDLPSQRVVLDAGGYRLELERVVPSMGWNAKVSLLTGIVARSEEHTSELQSLMRISYAVFCLKNKILHLI